MTSQHLKRWWGKYDLKYQRFQHQAIINNWLVPSFTRLHFPSFHFPIIRCAHVSSRHVILVFILEILSGHPMFVILRSSSPFRTKDHIIFSRSSIIDFPKNVILYLFRVLFNSNLPSLLPFLPSFTLSADFTPWNEGNKSFIQIRSGQKFSNRKLGNLKSERRKP